MVEVLVREEVNREIPGQDRLSILPNIVGLDPLKTQLSDQHDRDIGMTMLKLEWPYFQGERGRIKRVLEALRGSLDCAQKRWIMASATSLTLSHWVKCWNHTKHWLVHKIVRVLRPPASSLIKSGFAVVVVHGVGKIYHLGHQTLPGIRVYRTSRRFAEAMPSRCALGRLAGEWQDGCGSKAWSRISVT